MIISTAGRISDGCCGRGGGLGWREVRAGVPGCRGCLAAGAAVVVFRCAVRGRAAGSPVPVREGAAQFRGLVVFRYDGDSCGVRVVAGARSSDADGLRPGSAGSVVSAVLAALA